VQSGAWNVGIAAPNVNIVDAPTVSLPSGKTVLGGAAWRGMMSRDVVIEAVPVYVLMQMQNALDISRVTFASGPSLSGCGE
jgi:hypothetical protein